MRNKTSLNIHRPLSVHSLFSFARKMYEQIWAEYVDPDEIIELNKYLKI